MKRIFVGNLAFDTTEDALREHFSPQGEVLQVKIMTDRDTGRSRGFGFVEMAEDEEAARAITALNGKELSGRALTINEARPRPERSGGFRPGGGGGFGGKRRGGRDNFRPTRSPREPRW